MVVQTAGGTSVTFPDLSSRTAARVRKATERKAPDFYASPDVAFRKAAESRLIGLRVNRFSWWVHWRELADYILPRRYKWLITPNQMARGSPLSLWLAEVERIINLILAESNFYDSLAIFYFDLVVFGTAVMLIYEDFDNVIRCVNPCLGEYYVDNDGQLRPEIFAREFTYTVSQAGEEFGVENLSPSTASLWAQGGTSLTRELVVAHMVEPNVDGRKYGIPETFKYRECYWEWGGSASPQGGSSYSPGLLRKRGFYENPAIITRWDLVSNDAYGRSPGMDAL